MMSNNYTECSRRRSDLFRALRTNKCTTTFEFPIFRPLSECRFRQSDNWVFVPLFHIAASRSRRATFTC